MKINDKMTLSNRQKIQELERIIRARVSLRYKFFRLLFKPIYWFYTLRYHLYDTTIYVYLERIFKPYTRKYSLQSRRRRVKVLHFLRCEDLRIQQWNIYDGVIPLFLNFKQKITRKMRRAWLAFERRGKKKELIVQNIHGRKRRHKIRKGMKKLSSRRKLKHFRTLLLQSVLRPDFA